MSLVETLTLTVKNWRDVSGGFGCVEPFSRTEFRRSAVNLFREIKTVDVKTAGHCPSATSTTEKVTPRDVVDLAFCTWIFFFALSSFYKVSLMFLVVCANILSLGRAPVVEGGCNDYHRYALLRPLFLLLYV